MKRERAGVARLCVSLQFAQSRKHGQPRKPLLPYAVPVLVGFQGSCTAGRDAHRSIAKLRASRRASAREMRITSFITPRSWIRTIRAANANPLRANAAERR